ncbi:MFS transporter [Halalkalibacter okhensis]|uniref:MFS transporter n=1 Tax=Halalkalibacter okhensis TaxID=333138 RepID=UPI00068AB379|nr:MFS transporter [Halalkalibacter okhensis]
MYIILLVIHFLFHTSLFALKPVVSLYANSQGASALTIGALVSVYAFTPMLTALYVGKWLDRFGAKTMMFIGSSLTLLAVSIPVFNVSIPSIFITQMLLGFSQIFIVVSIQKTVGNLSGSRDKLIATLTFVGSGGSLVGPLIAGFTYDLFGVKAAFVTIVCLVSIGWFLILLLRKEQFPNFKQSLNNTSESSFKLLMNTKLRNALLIGGMVLYSKELFTAYFPIYASGVGVSASLIGIILSILAGASMVVRIIQHHLVHKFGRNHILFTTMVVSGLSYALVPLYQDPIPLIILAVFLGAGLGLGQPLSLVYAINNSPEGRQGEVLGMRITINRGAQFIAPILFGMIGSFAGISPIFWATGGCLLMGTMLTRRTQKEKNEDVP